MSNKPKIAVVLSGCGVQDGAEIHEAVMTLLALDRLGAEAVCFAPDVPQRDVINHLTGESMAETRNVLVEAARIARGAITSLAAFQAGAVDGMIFPGGFGAAKNLCAFAVEGPGCAVEPTVEAAIRAMHAAGKPIGALCIAPALLARVLGRGSVTIGQDAETARAVEAMGARHCPTHHGEVVVDHELRIATAPCYMLESTLSEIAADAEAVARAVLSLRA